MTPFGFTPDDGDEENGKPEDLNAMMRQMQEQIQKQFEQIGINPAGFVNPFAAFAQGGQMKLCLPLSCSRYCKEVCAAQGSQPIGTKDVTVVDNAFEIADLWLNEATVFPGNNWQHIHRSQSADSIGLMKLCRMAGNYGAACNWSTAAISTLLDQAMAQQAHDPENGEAMAGPMGTIAGLLRTFIGSLIATQLGQAIGSISTICNGAHDVGLPFLIPLAPVLFLKILRSGAQI